MYTVYVFFLLLLCIFCYVFCNLIQSSSPCRTFRTKRTDSFCNFFKSSAQNCKFSHNPICNLSQGPNFTVFMNEHHIQTIQYLHWFT